MKTEMRACGATDLSWLFPESYSPVPANNPGCPYEIGDRLTFEPTSYSAEGAFGSKTLQVQKTVNGTVSYINADHRFYRVEYETPGCIGHECFKY